MKNKFRTDNRPTEIHEIKNFQDFLAKAPFLNNCTVRNIDFTSLEINWDSIEMDHVTFIACKFHPQDLKILIEKNIIILSEPTRIPYTVYRNTLYDYAELNQPIGAHTIDELIYRHFSKYRNFRNINETLYQRIHDHAIDEALRDLLDVDKNGQAKKCVGFMGGHGIGRDSTEFWKCAELAWRIAKAGYFVITGGGPGIMEAANMGAYFSNYSLEQLHEAIQFIQSSPTFRDSGYEQKAQEIIKQFPDGNESLAIPTWFYGHEPSNAFSKYIAKYFSNAVREETLLAVALHGIIYCPGSAGTIQEVFADAAQNHYITYDFISPMVFFDKAFFTEKLPAFPLLDKLSANKKYKEYILASDDQIEIVDFIKSKEPLAKADSTDH